MSKQIPLESEEQEKLVNYLKILENQGKIITFYANVNENRMHKQIKKYAIIAEKVNKKLGKKKGVSDITIILKDKVLYIELKRAKKSLSKVSKEQINFLDKIKQSNVCDGSVCYGFEEAKEFIDKFLELTI